MLAFPSAPPPQHVWHVPQGHCELAKVTLLLRIARLNLTDFFQNPQRALPVHDAIHISRLNLGFLFWHLWMTYPSHARTPALMLHLTNPCTKQKVLSLTKPKGKIYKMKSLGHYITFTVAPFSRKSIVMSPFIYTINITFFY